jgi:hypothetical protein
VCTIEIKCFNIAVVVIREVPGLSFEQNLCEECNSFPQWIKMPV